MNKEQFWKVLRQPYVHYCLNCANYLKGWRSGESPCVLYPSDREAMRCHGYWTTKNGSQLSGTGSEDKWEWDGVNE